MRLRAAGNAPAKGPACTELILSTPNAASNPTQAIGQVTAYLQAHPQVQAVLTLNTAISDALRARGGSHGLTRWVPEHGRDFTVDKLAVARPSSLGAAARISGVTPASTVGG